MQTRRQVGQHKRRLSTFSWGNFSCRADRSCIDQRLTDHKYSLSVEHRLTEWFCSDIRPKYTLQLRHGISLSRPSIRRVYEASHIIKSALDYLAQRGIVMPKHLSFVNARMCLWQIGAAFPPACVGKFCVFFLFRHCATFRL